MSGPQTWANEAVPRVKCDTCGHQSSAGNFYVDKDGRAHEVCSGCRQPLRHTEES